jgi:hypothetical protein
LPSGSVFHSTFLLTEDDYRKVNFQVLKDRKCIFAVQIRGDNPEDFEQRTKSHMNEKLFWSNLDLIVSNKLNFYFSFIDFEPIEMKDMLIKRYGIGVMEDSFTIKISKQLLEAEGQVNE